MKKYLEEFGHRNRCQALGPEARGGNRGDQGDQVRENTFQPKRESNSQEQEQSSSAELKRRQMSGMFEWPH